MAADPQLWPFVGAGAVNWQPEWLTDILQPSAGLAQLRRLREHPRVRVAFDGLSSGSDRRWLENLLERNGGRMWRVPLPGAGFELAAAVAPGAAGLSGETAGTLIRPGARVALVSDDPRKTEQLVVDDVLPNGIVLAGNTVNGHSAGTRVLPVFDGRLSSIPALSRFTGDAVPWRAEFDLVDPLPIIADAGTTLYRTFPVLELPVDWSSDPSWQPSRDLRTEDNGTAPVWTADLLGQARPEMRRQCTAVGPVEVAQVLSLLWALAGRAQPVWVHTQAHDVVLTASAAAAATALDIEWSGLGSGARPPGRRDLRIALRSGTLIRRRVTAVTLPGGNVERLTLDAALGVAVAPADVLQMSWMTLCTQSADVSRINWWKHDVARVEFAFQAVPHEH